MKRKKKKDYAQESVKRDQKSQPTEPKLAQGPRKKAASGIPAPRLDTHKKRSLWFNARAAWPVREAPIQKLIVERDRLVQAVPPAASVTDWVGVGPSNTGGRMTCIVCHPFNPQRIWAGAAGGGVWRSDDAGKNWQPLWRRQDVLNVGSLALDPRNPDTLYCGTGEANLSADSYPGVGLYQTSDGGLTWNLLAPADGAGIPRRIGAVAIDPFISTRLLLGGVSHSASQAAGLYESTDSGVSWQRLSFVSPNNYWCHAIVFHPTKQGTIWVTVTAQGPRSGIWRTTDGGQHWSQLTTGLPDPSRFGRTSLSVCASTPDILYALAADMASGRADRTLGVFRSADGGTSWNDITGAQIANEGQMSYGNTIAVAPEDPNRVVCGGVDLYLSTNGGASWKQSTNWKANRGQPTYAHADHHCLMMPSAAPGRIYDMNDGGMDFSEDGGRNWQNRSSGLVVTMFYDVDVAQSDDLQFGGGAQDNGTIVTTDGRTDDYFEILGGDGGWIVYDPLNAGHLYASYYNMGIFRWRPGQNPEDVSPSASDEEKGSVWMCYITYDPSDTKTVFTGSKRVWRTKNDGVSWKAVSPNLDDSAISAIEVAPADSRRVYIGTEAGGLFRSTDGGNTWSPNIAGATLPGFTITRIETHPQNQDSVFITVANFGQHHVFRSDDGGITWTDIDKGRLPDVPHHALVIPPDNLNSLYVCNDVGVFFSPDLGQTWQNFSKNLPNVMVVDLVYHLADRALFAATYGRSIYKIRIP